jgi:glutamate--cysteine ligase catalytic subunit
VYCDQTSPQENKFVINKSRYGSVDCYISTDPKFKSQYNDLDLVYDKDICKQLQDAGAVYALLVR